MTHHYLDITNTTSEGGPGVQPEVLPGAPATTDCLSYYQAALRCLAFVEARHPTGRRFGPEADARWASFQGDLTTADRIDLLLRDADVEWPAAFGARSIFGLSALADDDPFGGNWPGLDAVDAETLWRATLTEVPPRSPETAVAAIAAAWHLQLPFYDPGPITATDRVLLVGPGAIAAAIAAFARSRDLDFAEQAVCLASLPAHRHLAAAAAAILNLSKPSALITAAAAGAYPHHTLLVSADAAAADLARLEPGRSAPPA